MKAILAIFIAIILLGCSPDTEKIGSIVATLLQQKLSENPELKKYNLTVQKVDVIREAGNSYRGIAKVLMRGNLHDVPLKIISDGNNVMFETPPENFAFILQEELKDAFFANKNSAPAASQEENSIPEDVKATINLVYALENDCRGRPGDDPVGAKACELREIKAKELKDLGFCYGTPEQSQAEKRWIKCAS